MKRLRIQTRRALRFLGLSRSSLLALAAVGGSFAVGRLALDAALPPIALAATDPVHIASSAAPTLESANPLEGGVAAFSDIDQLVARPFLSSPDGILIRDAGGDPEFSYTNPAADTQVVCIVKSSGASPHTPGNAAWTAADPARIERLSHEFTHSLKRFECVAKAPTCDEIVESLKQARRAARAFRVERLAQIAARTEPAPAPPAPVAAPAPAPAQPEHPAGERVPTWLISIAAWVLAGF